MPKVSMPNRGGRPTPLPKRATPTKSRQPKTYPPSFPRAQPTDKLLCAIDPGWTTGMAFRINGDLYTCIANSSVEVLEMIGGCQLVVIERFDTGGLLNPAMRDTIDLVGQVKGFCYAYEINLEIATPQMRYPFMEDSKTEIGSSIERMPKNTHRHCVDALAHLLAYEYRHRKDNDIHTKSV